MEGTPGENSCACSSEQLHSKFKNMAKVEEKLVKSKLDSLPEDVAV